MSPLATDAMRAGQHASVHHDAAADSSPENDPEDRPEALGSAKRGFGKGTAVGVVGKDDFRS